MTNSHNATSTKSCFSGILSRLLCTGSLPTHPSDSDHLPEFDKTDFINYLPKKNEYEVKGGGTPGVVARLMGLDSLPVDMTWLPNKDNSIHFRSRSVNSANYLSPLDLAAQESYHRRVRTSVSFREIPTTFLVCFDEQKSNGDQGLKIMAAKVAGADQVKRNTSQITKTSTTSTSGNKWNTKTEKVVVVKKKENRETNKRKADVDHKRNSLRVVQNNVVAHNKSNDVYVKSSMKMKRSAKPPVNLSKEEKVSVGIIKRSKQRVNPSRAKKVEVPEHSSVDSSPDSVGIISG